MTESTHARIPAHLKRYIVDQNYSRYTSEDQAVWRFTLRQLKKFLAVNAHESYLSGLEKTGITIERIPSIDEIDQHLVKLGWGAVPVSGFIPPAAFMEFQSLGVLPIASDMRTIEHVLYTPAPDIVHEAAGHAPILSNPEYAAYLRQYGEIARNAIISKEDLDQYEAIRILSDIKEDPRSSKTEIDRAERRLNEVNASIQGLSEAALLSRMNWWTAEYGLIGSLKDPKIFGAGLLSSIGEAQNCLSSRVKKVPLTVDCVEQSYDITEQQPQLYVTETFSQLGEVLNQLGEKLSYRRGGIFGLERAVQAQTVTTTELNSGVQISGQLKSFQTDSHRRPIFLQFTGPTQLCVKSIELAGQGTIHHATGFSSPIGQLKGLNRCLSELAPEELAQLGICENEQVRLQFESDILVAGRVRDWTYVDGRLNLISFVDCKVSLQDLVLFEPAWGVFDMTVGCEVVSVFGGPADRARFGQTEDFLARHIPTRSIDSAERKRFSFYADLREARSQRRSASVALADFRKMVRTFLQGPAEEWLLGVELLELSYQLDLPSPERQELLNRLQPMNYASGLVQQCVRDGVGLAAEIQK